ncbi:outer membrane protein assembly factor BamB family protein [Streptomyces sp. H27-D2]|uniref:outer membrane protein assembly factor BamB family protein n=1 Tax=Streptomyces sp. H27-D2 TaxID=3046304 RepID=UPI002DB9C86C|nr:PQQ-binding-like beta-propeller repeat protein [Streptomyces sp. H27-D2]MEC4020654.1 PQQ-binding-like beta-propeller repeat protein [Streptomyces sp. H27-D2]
MKQIRIASVIGVALSLGLITGCGGSGDSEAGSKAGGDAPKTGAKAPGAKGLAYRGAPIPGLAKQQAWSTDSKQSRQCAGDASLPADKQDGAICSVGDAVVLVESVPVDTEGMDEEEIDAQGPDDHFVGRLHDVATGKVRKTFDIKMPVEDSGLVGREANQIVQVGQWRDGSPAVLVRTHLATKAKGLKKATDKSVLTMYAPSGEKLGSSTFDDFTYESAAVRNGYVVDDTDTDTKLIPIGGGEARTLPYDDGDVTIGTGFGYTVSEDHSYQPRADWSVATDTLTGKEAWSTEDLAPPDSLRKKFTEDEASSSYASPLNGDRAILEWALYGELDGILTTIDAGTGRRLAEGPSISRTNSGEDDSSVLSPDGNTSVIQYGEGAVAWNTKTGEELWRQGADEQNITPLALPGNGVLYADLDEGGTVALDADTKKLLPGKVEEVPEFTDNGYAVVSGENGFFVFRTKTV